MSEQNAAAYGFGVAIGILSYHASAGNLHETNKALETTRKAAERLEATGIDLDLTGLTGTLEGGPNAPDYLRAKVAPYLANRRGVLQATIEAASSAAGLAYRLGVAIGIAEGQATAGEAARGIVHDSLGKAIQAAKGLGLGLEDLEAIRADTSGGADLQSIYVRITELRGYLGKAIETKSRPVIRVPPKS